MAAPPSNRAHAACIHKPRKESAHLVGRRCRLDQHPHLSIAQLGGFGEIDRGAEHLDTINHDTPGMKTGALFLRHVQ